MQFAEMMQPGGAMATSTKTNFSPQQISKFFWLPLQSQASDQSFRHINTYTSVSPLEKRPLKVSKHSISVGGISLIWSPT